MYETMFVGPFTAEALGRGATAQSLSGVAAWWAQCLPNTYVQGWPALAVLVVAAVIVWALPNSREILDGRDDGGFSFPRWRLSTAWAGVMAILAFASLLLTSRQTGFLYFQF